MAQSKEKDTKKTTPKKSSSSSDSKISSYKTNFKKRWDKNPSIFTASAILVLAVIFLAVLFAFNKGIFLAGKINGKFVTTPEFYSKLVSVSGKETWEQFVRETLIRQKASEKGLTASEEEIEKKLKDIEERFGGKEVFESTLKQNGTTKEEIKKQLEIQILVEKLLADKIKITKAEIATYRKQNGKSVANQTDTQIEEALRSQKLNEEFTEWYEEVQKNANISTFF